MRDRERVKVGTYTTRLSLAVKPVDARTGRRPVGRPRVSVTGIDVKPVENRSGYQVFVDLWDEPPNRSLTVSVDGRGYYRDEAREVNPTNLNSAGSAVVVKLVPKYSTLVRGYVRDGSGEGLSGAKLSVRTLGFSTETDADGEFFLFFERLPSENVTTENGRKLVKVNGEDPTIEATHLEQGETTATLPVEVGKVTERNIMYE